MDSSSWRFKNLKTALYDHDVLPMYSLDFLFQMLGTQTEHIVNFQLVFSIN